MVDLHRIIIELYHSWRQEPFPAETETSGKQSFQSLFLAEAVVILVEGFCQSFNHFSALRRTSGIESEKMLAGYPVASIDSGLNIMIGHIEGGADSPLQKVKKMSLYTKGRYKYMIHDKFHVQQRNPDLPGAHVQVRGN